jgi:RND family efflux transporter MFP subunit
MALSAARLLSRRRAVADLRPRQGPQEFFVEKSELLDQLRIDRLARPGARAWTWRIWAAGAFGLLAVLLAWYALSRNGSPTVAVATVRAMSQGSQAGSVLDATGYVTARRQATVSAKITGKVREVLIEEGMRVQEGQVLARLDDAEARAQVELARAQLAAARSQVDEARAQARQAQRDLVRQEELSAKKLVSVAVLDAARAEAETSEARAQSALRGVEVASEALKVAEVELDNTVVRAPFSGVVTVKAAQPGEMISPISAGGGFTRTGIGTIVDMDSLEIQVDVNESLINRVQAGQPVEALLNAYPEWKIPGAVIAIIPTADRSKATVRVRIAIKVKDPRIVPDMGVRVAFLSESGTAADQPAARPGVLVPAGAVREGGGQAEVFVVGGDKVELRAVKLGATFGEQRQVLAGLRHGERVVLSPPESLRDGDKVKVTGQSQTE